MNAKVGLTLQQVIQLAVAAYTAGEWGKAEQLARLILSAQADHSGALNLLGIMAAQSRRPIEAADLLSRAVEANRSDAGALCNYGNVLNDLRRFEEALDAYAGALQINPDYAEAYNNRGNTLRELNRHEEALDSYARALRLKPDDAESYNNRGLVLHELKRFQEALDSYALALRIKPDFAEAYNNRGNSLHQLKRFEDALDSYARAQQINPDYAQTYCNRGDTLRELKRFEEALASYMQTLRLTPDDAESYNKRGLVLHELKRFEEALDSYARALQIDPEFVEAYHNRGDALQELKRFEEALNSYACALQINPDFAEAYNNYGATLHELKRFEEACDNYARALQIKPEFAEAYGNRGNSLREINRLEEALESYARALRIKPGFAEVLSNRGNVLHELKRFDEALDSYARALQIKPDLAEAHNNYGATLHELKRFDEALGSFARALQTKPDYAEAYNNSGNTLRELNRFEDALDSYASALQIKPDCVEALSNRGSVLHELKRFEEALDAYARALEINPECDWLFGTWLHAKMSLCDWRDLESHLTELATDIRSAKKTTPPFPVLSLIDSLSLQRQATETWVNGKFPPSRLMPFVAKRAQSRKIRVGYFSGDYRLHAVSLLTAELIEKHDRSRFEVNAFSIGPDTQDEMRKRMERAFDRFIDVRGRSDLDIVRLARSMDLDIAVDLGGFTQGCRPNIFALRAAPLQVSYLGYLGTMGAPYIDYLIADTTIIPVEHQRHYAEKIAYLPSYQANDSKRVISDKRFSREELGLPRTGFVFCCFNASYKIMPETFGSWMRILKQVEGSVLFLLADHPTAERNLRKEALKSGVAADRLVFGGRLPVPEYLARYRTVDLFLDTLPYNAGTTASDALWAGLPVLTRIGESFAARVAASLLNAIRLPELITTTREHYEAMAIALARDPARMAELKDRLYCNRLTTPLFDTERFTRNLENAYARMYERYQADLAPDHINLHQWRQERAGPC